MAIELVMSPVATVDSSTTNTVIPFYSRDEVKLYCTEVLDSGLYPHCLPIKINNKDRIGFVDETVKEIEVTLSSQGLSIVPPAVSDFMALPTNTWLAASFNTKILMSSGSKESDFFLFCTSYSTRTLGSVTTYVFNIKFATEHYGISLETYNTIVNALTGTESSAVLYAYVPTSTTTGSGGILYDTIEVKTVDLYNLTSFGSFKTIIKEVDSPSTISLDIIIYDTYTKFAYSSIVSLISWTGTFYLNEFTKEPGDTSYYSHSGSLLVKYRQSLNADNSVQLLFKPTSDSSLVTWDREWDQSSLKYENEYTETYEIYSDTDTHSSIASNVVLTDLTRPVVYSNGTYSWVNPYLLNPTVSGITTTDTTASFTLSNPNPVAISCKLSYTFDWGETEEANKEQTTLFLTIDKKDYIIYSAAGGGSFWVNF